MSAPVVKIEHTQLPENTSRARELQWRMENWQQSRAQAASDRKRAWNMYADAVDDPEVSREEKEEIYQMATMFDDIADKAWREFENAKAEYLRLFN